MHKVLKKANNELINWCECSDAFAAYPGQMDCPWCGCGWLFTCLSCGKAFTFAEVVETDVSLTKLAREDLSNWDLADDSEALEDWLDLMSSYTHSNVVGTTVVYLDGNVFPATKASVSFDGWFAKHRLSCLPQVGALTAEELRVHEIAQPSYWFDRELLNRG